MRCFMPAVLGLLLLALAAPGIGVAQSTVQVRGTIQSVDCRTHTVFLRSAGGAVTTIAGAPSTAVYVNGAPVPFCTLRRYAGSHAVATWSAAGNGLVAGRINVLVPAAPAKPSYYPYYFPYTYLPWNYYGPPWTPGIGMR
jgi:hypothetical protein